MDTFAMLVGYAAIFTAVYFCVFTAAEYIDKRFGPIEQAKRRATRIVRQAIRQMQEEAATSQPRGAPPFGHWWH